MAIWIQSNMSQALAVERDAAAAAQAIATEIVNASRVNVEVHPLIPTHLGYSDTTIEVDFDKTIDDNCGLVFYGWWINDAEAKAYDIYRGNEFITSHMVKPIYSYPTRTAVSPAFRHWGIWKSGEELKITWKYTTATYVTAFPLGFAILPEGRTKVVK